MGSPSPRTTEPHCGCEWKTNSATRWSSGFERIEFIESEKAVGLGEGGKNEDDEYFDLLPNI
jgi:hypothetical protein